MEFARNAIDQTRNERIHSSKEHAPFRRAIVWTASYREIQTTEQEASIASPVNVGWSVSRHVQSCIVGYHTRQLQIVHSLALGSTASRAFPLRAPLWAPDSVRTFSTVSRARKRAGTRPSAGVRPAAREVALAQARRSSRLARAAVNPGDAFRWAPRAALRPFGPRRRRRAPGPGHRPRSWGPQRASAAARRAQGCHPPGDPALNRARSPSRARYARRMRWRKRHP